MKTFSDFNINIENKNLQGDKIKIMKILNREIIVHDFKIDKSKHNNGNCLTLQIELSGIKHVVFTSSTILEQQIKQVPEESFPFKATIVQEGERFQFQ